MLKKISFTTLFYAYVQGVAFLVFILTARYYGAEGRGILASVTSMGTFTATLLGLSIGSVIPYFIIEYRKDREVFFRERFFSLLAIIFLLTMVTFIALVATYFIRPALFGSIELEYLLAGALSLPYFMWIGSNDFLFSSAGKIRNQNIIGFYIKGAFLVVCFIAFSVFKISLLGFLILYGCFNLLQFFTEVLFFIRSTAARFFVDTNFIRKLIGKGLQLHAVSIAGILNTTFSVLVLNYYSKNDMRDVGNLNFATQLSSLLMVVPLVVNRYMYGEITAHGLKTGWKKQKKVIRYCLLFMTVVSIAAYFLIVPFTSFWGSEFTDAVPVFRTILIILVPSSFCTLMQSQWYSRGYFKVMSAINISVGIAGALITLYTIPRYGMYGAVITTLFTYIAFFIINVIFYYKIERGRVHHVSEPSVGVLNDTVAQ